MSHAALLIQRHFNQDRGVLGVGGIPVTSLISQYGTPSFVYDCGILGRRFNLLREVFPREFEIYYSVKANPHQVMLTYFLRRGCGLEIASKGEYLKALEAGCQFEAIVFAGPGKTQAELELVIAKGIGEIHIESLLELERITDICRRLNIRASLAVRINPTGEVQGGAMRMGGKPSPFGVDEEVVDSIVDRILESPEVDFCGIHLFTGTQILDHTVLLRQYRKAIDIARRIASRIHRPLRTVDFGGGLGVPYFPHERELDCCSVREGLAELMNEIRLDSLFSGTKFIIEPGRFLVGEAGLYITRITDIKLSRGKKFLVVDGGMHHHLAASGNLGQTIKRNYPIALINRLGEPSYEKVDVVGPLCTPLDTLAREVELPQAHVGDLIGIFQSGAYGLTASPTQFLSHDLPSEIFVENGEILSGPGIPHM